MKKAKIIYWFSTGIIALGGLVAGIMYMTNPAVAERFTYLGFPNYFRIELASAKIIGALVLILPMIANRIKEWAYAGLAIVILIGCYCTSFCRWICRSNKSFNSIISFSNIVCLLC